MPAHHGSKPFYGIYIVAACFLVLFMLWGMVFNTFPVFLKPIAEDMGWGRGALAGALLAGSLGAALTAPLAGVVIDRSGVRSVMLTGTFTMGLALLGGSRLASLWHLYAVFGCIGCGLMCATVIPCSLLISNWFVGRRGAAMSGAFVGTSVGGMVMSPVANWAIVNYGWRTAFACSGLAILVLVTPVILLVIRTHPSEIGLEPYGDGNGVTSGVEQASGLNLRQALSVPAFWQIAAVMLLVGLATTGVGTHCVAYLTDVGHSPARAAFAWSVVMGAMALGKLTFGPISDRWGPSIAMGGASAMIAVSIGILMVAKPFWVVLAFATTHGFAVGAPLVVFPLLIGEHLGMRHFATIYGVLNVVSTVGAAAGPVGAGLFFDARATYVPVFGLFAVLMLAGAVVSLLLKKRRQLPGGL